MHSTLQPPQSSQPTQPTQQHARPTPLLDDPHDAIVALLRGNAPAPRWSDPSELNITPAENAAPETISLTPPVERPMPPPPLSDKIDIIPDGAPPPRAGRGLMRFVITVCVGIAATVGWQAYGDEARQMFADYAPQLLAQVSGQGAAEPQAEAPAQAAAPQTAEATTAAQPAPDSATAPAQPAAPAAAPAQPAAAAAVAAPPAQPTAAEPAAAAAPVQAAIPPEVTQSLESMSQEIAALKETIEQLKSGQQQLTRELAKAKEQEPKRKTSASKPKQDTAQSPPPQRAAAAPPPPPVTTAPRAQAYPSSQPYRSPQTYGSSQAYPPPQTYGQAYPPTIQREAYIPPPRTLPPEPGFESTPRPPMPLQ